MKVLKIVSALCLSIFLFSSCLSDSRDDFIMHGNLPITTVIPPTTINPVGETTEIKVFYKTSNSCQSFVNFQSSIVEDSAEGKTYQISVLGVQKGSSCTNEETEHEKILEFVPTTAGDYTLKFWKGTNASGENQFKTITLTVEP